jgi:hypothetical protein
LNSSVYRLPLITTSVVAIVHGSEMSRKLGAIHKFILAQADAG